VKNGPGQCVANLTQLFGYFVLDGNSFGLIHRISLAFRVNKRIKYKQKITHNTITEFPVPSCCSTMLDRHAKAGLQVEAFK